MKTKRMLFYLLVGCLLLLAAAQSASAQDLVVTKTVAPGMIYTYGSGDTPDTTTVTLSVTGFGGTIVSTAPMDVVFAIDSSASMQLNDPTNLRLSGAQDLVDLLDPDRDLVGVVGWDDTVRISLGLTSTFAQANAAIGSIPSNGPWTNGQAGLEEAINLLDADSSTGKQKVIIFLTDGQFNRGDQSVTAARAAAVAKGYKVYTVGLTTNPDILETIAIETGGENYPAESADEIAAIYLDILTTVTTNTAPSYVDVSEVTMPFVVEEGDFSIEPDSVDTTGTETVITWNNVGQYVGNQDDKLDSTETFEVSFVAGSSDCGIGLAVDAESAKVHFIAPDGSPEDELIPQATIDVICPAIAVDKEADDDSVYRGDTVTYAYAVSNPGNIELGSVTVTDDRVTPTFVGGDTDDDGLLDVDETWEYTATAQPMNTVINTVIVKGDDPLGKAVEASDSETVTVTVPVKIDVKPGSCPNAFKIGANGVLPVALVGGVSGYTLDEIDLDSVILNGVPFVRYVMEDAATPYFGDPCGCTALTSDGQMDVSYKFSHPAVAATLGTPAKKAQLQLTMTGMLKDGVTLIEGKDCIVIS